MFFAGLSIGGLVFALFFLSARDHRVAGLFLLVSFLMGPEPGLILVLRKYFCVNSEKNGNSCKYISTAWQSAGVIERRRGS